MWRSLVAQLRRDAPPLLPVRVYRRRLTAALGTTDLVRVGDRPDHFSIIVHPGASFSYMRHILLHEWAHALAWTEGHEDVRDHGPEWALAFSRVYQLTVEP